MAPYLVVDRLIKRYESKTVLDIEEFVVNQGEVLAVIGPNGSGKSTLLRLIAHLEKPNSGSIRFASDKGPGSDLDIRRRLAFVFQEPLLFTGTVFDNIAYGLKVRGIKRGEIEQRVRDAAQMFGIHHLLDRPSNALSGGEAQRTSLARAFVLRPELLLLDEPTALLDPPTKESLLVDLYDVLEQMDTTVIYITHELTEAMILADRCAFIEGGRIIQVGTPQEVMASPVNRKIADFVGVENIIKGRVVGSSDGLTRVKVNGSEIEVLNHVGPTEKVWVLIRPENVTITLEEHGNTSARNRFSGIVKNTLDLGVLYRVVVDCGFPMVVFVTKRSVEEMALQAGKRVWISFKTTGVHVISREGSGYDL